MMVQLVVSFACVIVVVASLTIHHLIVMRRMRRAFRERIRKIGERSGQW